MSYISALTWPSKPAPGKNTVTRAPVYLFSYTQTETHSLKSPPVFRYHTLNLARPGSISSQQIRLCQLFEF